MIECKAIAAGYPGRPVLTDLSLTLKKGALTVLIGRNGSGKSTLLGTLVGTVPLTSGEITLSGTSLTRMPSRLRAQKLGFLPQASPTTGLRAAELVLLGRYPHLPYPRRFCEEDRAICLRAMETMHVSHLADRSCSSLSGGELQRVRLAMALAQETDFLLLDEPTAHLDAAEALDLLGILSELAHAGRGIVAVLHGIEDALRHADCISLINGGTCLFSGSPDDFLATNLPQSVFGIRITRLPPPDGDLFRIRRCPECLPSSQ